MWGKAAAGEAAVAIWDGRALRRGSVSSTPRPTPLPRSLLLLPAALGALAFPSLLPNPTLVAHSID
jgi:hypothetical protein